MPSSDLKSLAISFERETRWELEKVQAVAPRFSDRFISDLFMILHTATLQQILEIRKLFEQEWQECLEVYETVYGEDDE